MFYEFPVNLTLDEVRSVVRRHNQRLDAPVFIEVSRGDHIIFNYAVSFDGAFPEPNTDDPALNREYAIIRECRGLVFSTDGRVLARRFQKFFNVNEKEFTQAHLIDWTHPHIVLEKLDGSMITPYITSDGALRWATKMGLTDQAAQVEAFIGKPENFRYVELVFTLIGNGQTPIFEWCSRKQKIVVDYKVDQLILTAIRDNQDGTYESYADMNTLGGAFGVPVVQARSGGIENIDAFLEETRALEGVEGYIIRFDNGHMLKVKCDWYVQIHRAKDNLTREKEVWQMILNETVDDVLPLLDADDQDRVTRFQSAFLANVMDASLELILVVDTAKKNGLDKKAFAAQVSKHRYAKLLFGIWDGRDPVTVVCDFLKRYYFRQNQIDEVRPLIAGLRWDDFRDRTFSADD